jgi:hypothetical protein
MKGAFQRLSESAVFEYRSDIVLKRKECSNFPQGKVFLRFSPKGQEVLTFSMTGQQAEDLARELRAAIDVMKSVK